MENKHGNWAQTLFKYERRHVYHVYWPLWKKLSLKKSLLVICNILRLFVNTFTSYDKYSLLNRDYLKQPNQMQLSIKTKYFFSIFFCSFKTYIKSWKFSKKRGHSELMYFQNYGLPKARSDKSLKSAVSQYPTTRNMVNAPKHCANLNEGSFTIFIYYCKDN